MLVLRNPEWWRELAKTIGQNGHVIFSLDGLKDTTYLYRQNVNWDICMDPAEAFINAGGRARWDYLIFHSTHSSRTSRSIISKRMGFEKFMRKTGRFSIIQKQQPKTNTQGKS